MNSYILITSGWYDDDVVELSFEVCDGTSRFVNSAYVAPGWFEEEAVNLRTFSHQVYGGIYNFEAGERGPEYAQGAFEARFHFYRPTHLYISTFQQSEYIDFKGRQVAAEATLYLRTEPGLLDAFVGALPDLKRGDGAGARLTCIPLHGA